jgi:hypothetical protein
MSEQAAVNRRSLHRRRRAIKMTRIGKKLLVAGLVDQLVLADPCIAEGVPSR